MSMCVAVMLPSLLWVPLTRTRAPVVTALAVAAWPLRVYWVDDVAWMVTLVPSAALATIVWPLMLETVSGAHWLRAPDAPGARESEANGWPNTWEADGPPAAALAPRVPSADPTNAPTPSVRAKASARPATTSQRGP